MIPVPGFASCFTATPFTVLKVPILRAPDRLSRTTTPSGSVSDVIDVLRAPGTPQRLGILGLGAGTMAAFADSAHHVTFYEIDPAVEPIARRYFTFLPRCGANCDIIIGDGRLQLAREHDGTFDLLLLDAFSSDSVPTHLLSREALHIYLSKLKPDGLLLFHVSNRYLDVEKLVPERWSWMRVSQHFRGLTMRGN